MVFSTIHANEAAGAVSRLLDLDVKETSIGPAVRLIVGERLVRRLCDACKKPQALSDALKGKIEEAVVALPSRVDRSLWEGIMAFEAVGCAACTGTGYRGRVGIFEVMRITQGLERLIIEKAGEREIESCAIGEGMATMRQDGVVKVLCGITTIEEVEAATGRLT